MLPPLSGKHTQVSRNVLVPVKRKRRPPVRWRQIDGSSGGGEVGREEYSIGKCGRGCRVACSCFKPGDPCAVTPCGNVSTPTHTTLLHLTSSHPFTSRCQGTPSLMLETRSFQNNVRVTRGGSREAGSSFIVSSASASS